ncbi:MAG: hypothetical protein M3P08_04085 [Thermoproteota archaeon]|nr:hypothetical protein [Thermoproteota archaeon]
MAKINIVIDDESVARFGGLHVKRYYADPIVMTDTDIIKNDLDAGDNQSGITSIFNGRRRKVYLN